jgi:hypothetical protein
MDFKRYLGDEPISTNSDIKTVRLYGDSTLGYYYINLFFGSNLQKASLIVDTGSTITAIPCSSNFSLISIEKRLCGKLRKKPLQSVF